MPPTGQADASLTAPLAACRLCRPGFRLRADLARPWRVPPRVLCARPRPAPSPPCGSVVRDEIARGSGDADQLAAAHEAARTIGAVSGQGRAQGLSRAPRFRTMKMGPALQRLIRRFGLICGIVWLATAPGFPTSIGWAQAQNESAAPNDLAARIDAEFEAVKERAVHVRLELPRLGQALETFAAHLKDRADLSPADKAAALARIEQARAVLRSHDATLRSATTALEHGKGLGRSGSRYRCPGPASGCGGRQDRELCQPCAGLSKRVLPPPISCVRSRLNHLARPICDHSVPPAPAWPRLPPSADIS